MVGRAAAGLQTGRHHTEVCYGTERGTEPKHSGTNIEINLGSEDPVVGFMLHIRGSGDDVLPVAARIAAAAGGRAWDIPGERFLSGDPTETDGWHGFQRYRDQILGDG